MSMNRALINLTKHGIEVFGSKENFERWLATENFYIGGKPEEYLNTVERIGFLNDRLTGLEYGDNA